MNRADRRASAKRTKGRVGPERLEAITRLTTVSGISWKATAVAVRIVALRLEVAEIEMARSLYERITAGAGFKEAVLDEAIARKSPLAGKTPEQVHAWLFSPLLNASPAQPSSGN